MNPESILLPASCREGDVRDPPAAVIEYVNALRAQLWSDAEIPEVAYQIYYADFYVAQVENGGHAQFFLNATPWNEVADLALRGLLVAGAEHHAGVLRRALTLLDASAAIVKAVESRGWGAMADVAPAFSQVDNSIRDLERSHRWAALASQFLRSSEDVEFIEPADYETRMQALAEAVPNREARRTAADTRLEALRPRWEKDLRSACRERGIAFERLTAGHPQPDGSVVWAFHAEGLRRARVRGGELEDVYFDGVVRRTSWVSRLLGMFGFSRR